MPLTLARLEAFTARRALPVLAMKPRDADDFAYSLSAEGRASASIRRDLAASSLFFAFLERCAESVHNPFRGTKTRPEKRARKTAAYPSKEEAALILNALAPEARAAASVMLFRGLQVGALPSLMIRGERFTARSKGKDIAGALPAEALAAVRASELDPRRPFAETSETKLADAIRKRTAKLAKNGSIAAVYVNADFNLPVGGADIFLDRIKRQTPGFAGTLKGSTHQATVLSAFGCTT
jgi:hypothetical protein